MLYLSRLFCFVTLALALAQHPLAAQLTLHITAVPTNTPNGATLYMAGNFNAWNPSATPLQPNADGSYSITINPSIGLLEYKFTRGTWNSVEGNESGSYLPNRTYNYTGGVQTINNLQVATWEDLLGTTCVSSANSQVSVMATDFYMPQLDRYRRIWVYLPNDYANDTSKHYPVIYMHDAQNLFDMCGSFAGEWEIDETLHQLQTMQGDYGAIVVGIDNGGALRIDEYSPWLNPTYGGGDGDDYADFIVQTLKPYIDQQYRTLPNREHTAIVGSSMGGLISFYTALQYQDVFACAGIFSPSFWFSDAVFNFAQSHPKEQNMRLYFLAGGLEGTTMVSDMQTMYNLLLTNNFTADELYYKVVPSGQHSEWFWADEFGAAYTWLFDTPTLSINPTQIQQNIHLYTAPTDSALTIELLNPIPQASVQLFDINGKLMLHQSIGTQQHRIATQQLPKGMYLLRILKNGITQYCTKYIKN